MATLPIPQINTFVFPTIERLIKEVMNLKQENNSADTESLENKIDQLVYQLYDLTEEEIKIVEGK